MLLLVLPFHELRHVRSELLYEECCIISAAGRLWLLCLLRCLLLLEGQLFVGSSLCLPVVSKTCLDFCSD